MPPSLGATALWEIWRRSQNHCSQELALAWWAVARDNSRQTQPIVPRGTDTRTEQPPRSAAATARHNSLERQRTGRWNTSNPCSVCLHLWPAFVDWPLAPPQFTGAPDPTRNSLH